MAETESKTKVRLYKVAKEYNLSHDTLIDFLVKRGFDIKNHMSQLDEEMLLQVEKHYKKEKSEAERHARKRKEFDEADKRRRGEDKKPEDEEAPHTEARPAEVPATAPGAAVEIPETPDEAATPAPEPEPPAVPDSAAVEAPAEETPVPETAVPELPSAEAPAVEAEVPEVEAPAPAAAEAPVAKEAAETAETAAPAPAPAPPAKALPDLSLEAAVPKMRGLRVMGKIDLKAATPEKRGEKGAAAKPGESAEDAAKRKKKKKKRVIGGKPEGTTTESTDLKGAKRGKKGKAREVDQAEVSSAIKKTMAAMSDYGPISGRSVLRRRKRQRREEVQQRESEQAERESRILRIYEYATVSEIANLMNVPVGQVISSLIGLGVMASINQRLDMETITLVASEFGFEVQPHEDYEEDQLADIEDEEETLQARPPIVTVMGHVDHGKTKLLDFIRKTNVVAGESGGITQHIGAYTVTLESGRRITFLDTPGHEAFTAMRARGAQVTDIVVLVVAADDSVMPQTVEAINHALAARVPIVVAINKIDKTDANIDRIKQQLADRGVLVEEWGGRYGAVPISAKEGTNMEQLLERIVLEADILDLKANHDRFARGTVIESELDKGKGIVSTVLVQKGTLRVGDAFVGGNNFGKVRALLDERGNRVSEATPSTPVQVLGFNGSPQAGDAFVVVENDREAREIATVRMQIKRESDFRRVRRTTLDDISAQIKLGGVQNLAIVVKGDVDGSVEALADSLLKLSTEEVRIEVIHKSVGAISESDVLLASASGAIIIGFHVRPNLNARKLAETEEVDIRLYEIIYDAIEDVRSALEGMLRPLISEKVTATVLVRDIFKISHVGTIAGCYVQDGKIVRGSRVRLLRDGIVVFTGGIESLKRFKDDVREVDTGFECGISLAGYNDIKAGDIIESFEQVETKRTLG